MNNFKLKIQTFNKTIKQRKIDENFKAQVTGNLDKIKTSTLYMILYVTECALVKSIWILKRDFPSKF